MEVKVLRANVTDAQALLEAKIDAFSSDVDTYGFGPPEYDSLENQIRVLGDPNAVYYKIVADKEIIGGACVFDLKDGHYRLGSLYIVGSSQNKGIGTMAFEFIMSQYPHAVKWTLETPYKNFRNHHFYEKLGFVKTDETEPAENGFYLFVYEKLV